jgi:hypothetical protein
MAEHGPCEICGNQAQHDRVPGWTQRRSCPRCGMFEYNDAMRWPTSSPDEMVRLSGWIREQNAAGVVSVPITREVWRRVSQMPMPGLRERTSRALMKLARDKSDTRFSRDAVARDPELQGISYSLDEQNVDLLIRILIEENSLRVDGGTCAVTAKGLLAAEALQTAGSNSAQGFVAMSFDPNLNDAWTNGFDPGIRAAGFRPVRIDKQDYIGGISDQIMAEIRRSRFVVADYTGQRNGVYFEAGFGLGLGLVVIPTCRADEVDNLHFDIKHLNTLPWNTPAVLANDLTRRIRAVIGVGPDAPDPM